MRFLSILLLSQSILSLLLHLQFLLVQVLQLLDVVHVGQIHCFHGLSVLILQFSLDLLQPFVLIFEVLQIHLLLLVHFINAFGTLIA